MKPAASLKRVINPTRSTKLEIVIVCEGKVTEPQYFKDFRALHRNSLVDVRTVDAAGVPISVVETAVEQKKRLQLAARRNRNSFDVFQVWAVFDRDDHPQSQIPNAFALARSHGIHVAYSNPCFEVWGLMHFCCWSKPGHHKETQRDLMGYMQGYCHQKNPRFDVAKMDYETALSNAKKAADARCKEGSTKHGDPSTSVHLLTEMIRKGILEKVKN